MDQCDSLITKLITMVLDWYSGDIDKYEKGIPENRRRKVKFTIFKQEKA